MAKLSGDRSVTVVKSDGSSLYKTRDLAAAIARHDQYDFDRMYYVVERSQKDHFKAVFELLQLLGFEWADRLVHVKFGRIKGMSSRKGSAVFLTDVIEETVERMAKQQEASPNTRKRLKINLINLLIL